MGILLRKNINKNNKTKGLNSVKIFYIFQEIIIKT